MDIKIISNCNLIWYSTLFRSDKFCYKLPLIIKLKISLIYLIYFGPNKGKKIYYD